MTFGEIQRGRRFMRKRDIFISFIVLCFVFACYVGLFAQEKQENQKPIKYSTKIKINISANDKIKGELTSYLTRELRELNDVTIVDKKADWVLEILGIDLETKNGYKNGFCISVIILKPFGNGDLIVAFLQDTTIERTQWSNLAKAVYSINTNTDVFLNAYSFCGSWIRTGAPDEMKKVCQGVIADFDSEYLEPERKQWQIINE